MLNVGPFNSFPHRSTRRAFLLAALAAPLASFAQKKPAKVYRVGVLIPGTPAATAHLQEAFKQGLRELGYVEGQNVIIERRYGEGKSERLSDLAAELVRNELPRPKRRGSSLRLGCAQVLC